MYLNYSNSPVVCNSSASFFKTPFCYNYNPLIRVYEAAIQSANDETSTRTDLAASWDMPNETELLSRSFSAKVYIGHLFFYLFQVNLNKTILKVL